MQSDLLQPDSILQKTYNALKDAIPVLERFPKSQKFTLGDRLQNLISDLLELLIEAHFASKPDKRLMLHQVNIKLEKLRFFIRLSYELGHLSMRQYDEFVRRYNEIGRMTGGWIKSIQ